MSYSPTVYFASIDTPRLRARRSLASAILAAGAPAAPASLVNERRTSARVLVEVLDQPGRGVAVEVIDQRLLATWICSRRMKVGTGITTANSVGLALEVVGHREHGAIAVAHQHDLRRAVEDAGVGLRDVEAAERAKGVSEPGLKRQHQQSGDEETTHGRRPLLKRRPARAARRTSGRAAIGR